MDIIKKIENFSLYFTISLILLILLIGVLIYFTKKDKFADYKKYALSILLGYSIAIIAIMSFIEFDDIFSNDDLDMSTYGLLFYPLVVESCLAVLFAIIGLIFGIYSKDKLKYVGIFAIVALLLGFVAIVVCMNLYSETVIDWYPNLNLTALIICAVVFSFVIVAIYFLGDKQTFNTKSLVYGAISIALAFALSYIKMFRLPQGGSITLCSMLPLIVYSCMFGARRGTIICLIYGLLQAVQDPWIIHPAQFLLDYPLAYGLLGVSGLLMEKQIIKKYSIFDFILGAVVAVFLRWLCHSLSGVYAFADYADLDSYSTVYAYSFAYNSFVLIDMLISVVAGSTLFTSKSFKAQLIKSTITTNVIDLNSNVDEEDDEIDKIIINSQNKDDKD